MRRLGWFGVSLAGCFALTLTVVRAAVLLPVPDYPGAAATYIRAIND